MASLFGGGGRGGGEEAPAQTKEDLMRRLQAEISKKKLSDLVQATQKECFKRCFFKSSSSSARLEQDCIEGCVDKYWQTFDIVATEWNKNVSRA